jgi:hypothetical protein
MGIMNKDMIENGVARAMDFTTFDNWRRWF